MRFAPAGPIGMVKPWMKPGPSQSMPEARLWWTSAGRRLTRNLPSRQESRLSDDQETGQRLATKGRSIVSRWNALFSCAIRLKHSLLRKRQAADQGQIACAEPFRLLGSH